MQYFTTSFSNENPTTKYQAQICNPYGKYILKHEFYEFLIEPKTDNSLRYNNIRLGSFFRDYFSLLNTPVFLEKYEHSVSEAEYIVVECDFDSIKSVRKYLNSIKYVKVGAKYGNLQILQVNEEKINKCGNDDIDLQPIMKINEKNKQLNDVIKSSCLDLNNLEKKDNLPTSSEEFSYLNIMHADKNQPKQCERRNSNTIIAPKNWNEKTKSSKKSSCKKSNTEAKTKTNKNAQNNTIQEFEKNLESKIRDRYKSDNIYSKYISEERKQTQKEKNIYVLDRKMKIFYFE
ncbi:hypothetical protein EDEG_01217 [Edhazardia aedis USNM 41457]|uniref:Uncharacterized protein n=1 Tax=Edhazardia aedis (strain USNM 41457) TaxID=1003232 RepID=J8ZY64_EDHAE|nr:hypothetical protein EDEG_01217 [Edhazardia aedis USNM 41457]|eukprot:EJW04568.1 hypothetical protein EDEG_01217 [Edhazardia aedis USNM 41457]